MSVSYIGQGYLNAGVPAYKIMGSVACYGHTWPAQGMSSWYSFGGTGSIQDVVDVSSKAWGSMPAVRSDDVDGDFGGRRGHHS